MSSAPRVRIPPHEVRWRFSRSSGPGGQNVNTRDTRVELRWSLEESEALSPAQKDRARARLASRLTDGEVTIASSRYRSQNRNREDAHARLEALVVAALAEPVRRKPSKPSRASKRRGAEAKKRRSETKQLRRPPTP